jgi:hypothetical protein
VTHYTASRIAELQAQITAKQAQLTAAYTAYEEIIAGKIQSYRFDSGEGEQQARYVDWKELGQIIEALEAQIDWIRRKLQTGGGLRAINVRRLR